MKILILIVSFLSFAGCSTIKKYTRQYLGAMPKRVDSKKSLLRAVWIKNTDPSYKTGNLPIALNSPLIAKGMLFNGSNEKGMIAYDLELGTIIWSQKEKGSFHAPPVSYEDKIIYGTTEGRIFARDYVTGDLLYSLDVGSSVESKPAISNGRIVFHLRNHKIITLDIKTGKILWAYKRSVPFATTVQRSSTPLVHKNRLYIGFADGYVAAFSLEDGMVLWEQKLVTGNKFVDVDASPIIFNEFLLAGSLSGPLVVLNKDSGKIIRTLDYNLSRSPTKFKKGLLLGTIQGDVIWMDQSFNEIKKINLGSNSISSIVPWKNFLAVSNVGGSINILDNDSLEVLQQKKLGHAFSAIFGQMTAGEKKLAILSARNRLYVFK